MSGFISKTGQKWRELMGAHITKDEILEGRKAEVNQLDQQFRLLFSSYHQISSLNQQLAQHSRQIASIIGKFYENQVNTNKKIGVELQALFNNLGELYISKVNPFVHLGDFLKEWFITIEQLQPQMKMYHEERLVYDHYLEKVEKLRLQQQSDRRVDIKANEKLQRNENKYVNASSNFQKISKDIIIKLNSILDNRFKMINGSIQEFIIISSDLHGCCKSQLKKNINLFEKFKHPEPRNLTVGDKAKSIIGSLSDQVNDAVSQAKNEVQRSLTDQERKIDEVKEKGKMALAQMQQKSNKNAQENSSSEIQVQDSSSPSNKKSDNSSQIIYSPIQQVNSRSPNQSQTFQGFNQNPFFQDEIQITTTQMAQSNIGGNQQGFIPPQQQSINPFAQRPPPQGQRPPPQPQPNQQFPYQNPMAYTHGQNPFQDDFPPVQQPSYPNRQQQQFSNNDPFSQYDFDSLVEPIPQQQYQQPNMMGHQQFVQQPHNPFMTNQSQHMPPQPQYSDGGMNQRQSYNPQSQQMFYTQQNHPVNMGYQQKPYNPFQDS